MPTIDAHVHLYPPEVNRDPAAWAAAHGEVQWSTLCTRRRKSGQPVQGFPSVDELLRTMDAAGVDRAVLLGWYWERPATCRMHNRFLAECAGTHRDRLSAFATIHPAAGLDETLGEIGWAREAGMCGLGELSPHAQGYGGDEPVFRAALARAGEWQLPVNLHVTDPGSRKYPGRVDTPLDDFRRLAREHPATRFILAHWGGGLAFDPRMRELGNTYFDSAASPLLYGPDVWERATTAVGAERLLFGSDFPLVLYPEIETEPSLAGLLTEARAHSRPEMLGANAARLLGIA